MNLTNDQKRYLEELMDLLKIPSISADSNHIKDVRKAAKWIENSLIKAGCDNAEIVETKGHPIVYGEKIINSDLPTILVYGHYDVQPPDPIELWDNPPFDPVIKKTNLHPEGAIFARGSCDDKGQMFMHIKALELMLLKKELKCNVKFMIEGEEEIGSNNLEIFVKSNIVKLKSDIILISDTGIISNKQPSITTGLRGLSYMEVKIIGPDRDLHSGLYGGAVPNPINILCKIIAKLKDKNNKITIPGFYDKVVELDKKNRIEISKEPFNLDEFKKSIKISDVIGEKNYSTIERKSIRPTLDVNGIWGGYSGEGAKTVIPSEANAKISMRLVPDQDWKEISILFENYFKSLAPKSVSVQTITHHGGYAYVTPEDTSGFKAAFKAYYDTFGVKPLPSRGGGSIPIVPMFEKELNVKSILMGFGLDSDSIHSPNEHFGLFNFFKGIETIEKFYKYFSETESLKIN
jgi:acetylornithine deacetylase/succinyl-diaminopimelate desuccinylase-like protein